MLPCVIRSWPGQRRPTTALACRPGAFMTPSRKGFVADGPGPGRTKAMRMWRIGVGALAAGLAVAAGGAARAQAPQGLDKLSHILVLYMENRSFDNVFG